MHKCYSEYYVDVQCLIISQTGWTGMTCQRACMLTGVRRDPVSAHTRHDPQVDHVDRFPPTLSFTFPSPLSPGYLSVRVLSVFITAG